VRAIETFSRHYAHLPRFRIAIILLVRRGSLLGPPPLRRRRLRARPFHPAPLADLSHSPRRGQRTNSIIQQLLQPLEGGLMNGVWHYGTNLQHRVPPLQARIKARMGGFGTKCPISCLGGRLLVLVVMIGKPRFRWPGCICFRACAYSKDLRN